jgi:hypothetical protein
LRYPFPPLFLEPEIAAIANHKGCALREAQRHFCRIPDLHDQSDAPPGQCSRRFLKSLQHEMVMSQICFRETGGQPKPDEHGQPERIGAKGSVFEGMIEVFALRLLHPIENISACADRLIVEQLNPVGMKIGASRLGHALTFAVAFAQRNAFLFVTRSIGYEVSQINPGHSLPGHGRRRARRQPLPERGRRETGHGEIPRGGMGR